MEEFPEPEQIDIEDLLARANKEYRDQLEKIEAQRQQFIETELAKVEENNKDLPREDFRQPNEREENYGDTPQLNNVDENIHNDGQLDAELPANHKSESEPYAPVEPPATPVYTPLSLITGQ